MEENKTISSLDTVSFLKLNKSDLKSRAEVAIQAVKDGWVDPLEAAIMIKKTEAVLDFMKEEIKPLALDKMVEKNYSAFDVDITKSMLGVKYDYSACGDTEWNEINEKFLEISKQKKEREKFLQSLTKPLTEVNEETGEITKIYPPVKTGTEGLTLKIK